MKKAMLAVMFVACLSSVGCASFGSTEAQQLAYNGKGPNPCLFGGVTDKSSAHCIKMSQGVMAFLDAVNQTAIQKTGYANGNCQTHVVLVRKALRDDPDVKVQSIFSCPKKADSCHVSALVTLKNGQAVVLDNGAVSDQILSWRDFKKEVNGSTSLDPYKLYVPNGIMGGDLDPDLMNL